MTYNDLVIGLDNLVAERLRHNPLTSLYNIGHTFAAMKLRAQRFDQALLNDAEGLLDAARCRDHPAFAL